VRFDIANVLFVTAGRQHVRWGTGRIWTPADFLHPQPKDPVDVYDARLGTTMAKLHVPWEATGWNFYAYGLAERAGSKLGDVAGAARAEIVLGTTELGAGALIQANRKPKLELDLSTGLIGVDLYGEIALRDRSEVDRIGFAPEAVVPDETPLPGVIDARYPASRGSGLAAQVTGGLTHALQYGPNDSFTIGAEYFYNGLGYDDPSVYLGLLLPRTAPLAEPATPFYFGRHYGAVFLLFPAPFSWDLTRFSLSTIGNLSDRSFITRLDFAISLVTRVSFEAFAAVRYGRRDGELRFGLHGVELGPLRLDSPPGLLDLGLAVRLSI
jgi:hypothetical protein